jgi:hypothetical protein
MKKVVLFAVLGMGLTGCATITQKHQMIASGQTGCAPETIVIEDERERVRIFDGVYETWTAKCAGKTYRCAGSEKSGTGSCREAQ